MTAEPRPRLSPIAQALAGGDAADGLSAWALHARALEAAARGEDVIVLSVGDPDLDTPAPIRAAAKAALDAGDTHYTPLRGRPELRRAVAERFSAQFGRAVETDEVMISAGAQNALFLSCHALLGPGDEVLAPEPAYVSYAPTIASAGARLVRTPSPADTGFRPDLDALAAAITPATRALLICDPSNPTGVVLTPEERRRIVDLALERDLWLLADTVYEALCFDRAYGFLGADARIADRLVTFGGVSKSHAMTGWRIGWAVAPPDIVSAFETLAHCALYGLPGFAQAGALAAVRDPDGAAQMRDTFRRRRDLLVAGLAEIPGLRPAPPEAGMFAMLDVRALTDDPRSFADALYEVEGVSTLDGAAFGPSAAGFLRVSAAVSEARLAEAVRRIARFCARR